MVGGPKGEYPSPSDYHRYFMEEMLPWAILRLIRLQQSSVTTYFMFVFRSILHSHEAFNNSGYTCELMYNCRMPVNSIIVSCTCWDSTKAYFKGKRFRYLWKCENTALSNQKLFKDSQVRSYKIHQARYLMDVVWRVWPTACGLEPAPHPRTVVFNLSQDFWTKCAQRCWGKRDRGDFDFDLACKCW